MIARANQNNSAPRAPTSLVRASRVDETLEGDARERLSHIAQEDRRPRRDDVENRTQGRHRESSNLDYEVVARRERIERGDTSECARGDDEHCELAVSARLGR